MWFPIVAVVLVVAVWAERERLYRRDSTEKKPQDGNNRPDEEEP